uniref:EGF-like domain-containing protein n=1 Tax=Haptolina ericina TaxID=156174 RepID=A0A7S3AGB0_9EUKA
MHNCPFNCSGHGHCGAVAPGKCKCVNGASGSGCERVVIALNENESAKPACPFACSGHGSCSNGVCLCDLGYSGTACSIMQPSVSVYTQCENSCSGHGHCVSVAAPTVRVPTSHSVSRATMELAAEYFDAYSPPPPTPTSLLNRLLQRRGARLLGGEPKASPMEGDRHTSSVLRDAHPTLSASSERVLRHLKLIQGSSSNGHGVACVCDNGFSGSDCSVPTFSCDNNCSGAGLCLSDPPPISSSPCGTNGCAPDYPTYATSTPVGSTPTCHCVDGHSGSACELRASTSVVTPSRQRAAVALAARACQNNCGGHGMCVGGVCSCDMGFSGSDCGLDGRSATVFMSGCPASCSGNGLCRGGACVCRDGYDGVDCSRLAARDARQARAGSRLLRSRRS